MDAGGRVEERVFLRAGELSCEFEPGSLGARWIQWKGVEILRGINAPLRDQHWSTLRPVVDYRVRRGDGRFSVEFKARYKLRGEYVFNWTGHLLGTDSGEFIYLIEGYAEREFHSNRAGFCVLHPATCSGMDCVVEHTGGIKELSRFPVSISPHQPFLDIRSVHHEPVSGLSVNVTMEGDVFEMEDQRNWTDASFKTYCRPLAEPRPFLIARDQPICQSVTLSIKEETGMLGGDRGTGSDVSDSEALWNPVGMPRLGLVWNVGAGSVPLASARLVPQHVFLDFDTNEAGALHRLEQAVQAVSSLESILLIRWVVREADAGVVAAVEERVRPLFGKVEILPIDAETGSSSLASMELAGRIEEVRIGSGTDGYFAEFNREKPVFDSVEFVSFLVVPQVHAFDDESLLETISMQSVVLENAHAIARGIAVHVGPISLLPRWRSSVSDRRQIDEFGALWLLGSVVSLAKGGSAFATYWNATGEGGFVDVNGKLTPAGMVLQAMLDCSDDAAFSLAGSSAESGLHCLAFKSRKRVRLLVANLSHHRNELSWEKAWGQVSSCMMFSGGKPTIYETRRIEVSGRSAFMLELK